MRVDRAVHISRQQRAILAAADCEVRFDDLTRRLYATDASHYEIDPCAVAFPAGPGQTSAVLQAAAEAGMPVVPRGAGTGLVGGAIGEGLILDLAKHNHRVLDLDLEQRKVRVEAGVVLDQLNGYLKPHGVCFGPDVATSSRATIGGMIANNSSGANVPVYGTTADHVRSLDLVMAGGDIVSVGRGLDSLPAQAELIRRMVCEHASEIDSRMPAGLLKRWPGYPLDRCLRQPDRPLDILSGSEGTLAVMIAAELQIVPCPKSKGLGLVFFRSVSEAMQATVALLDLNAAAIEHVDRVLLDQTKGQLVFQAARDLLQLDSMDCESLLMVEFYEDIAEHLQQLAKKGLGSRTLLLDKATEMNLVWNLRKAGLSLLTGCRGRAKPVTGVEDAAVHPSQLPAYVSELQTIFTRLGLNACFYGHAASGLLHVRPVLDLQVPEDRLKFRQVADEVSSLVKQFKGSLAGEHGVGLARTEYMAAHLGNDLLRAMESIKKSFDPQGQLNPGKIFGAESFRIDRHLRSGFGDKPSLPFEPRLAFAAKDGSFIGNLEQCNGCGGCRKASPTMCPTFVATGEEVMSTRGRANAIRASLLDGAASGHDAWNSEFLATALSNCLSCKACTSECPSNVNMSLLKAELVHAQIERHGLTWQQRMVSMVDVLGQIGCLAPGLANWTLKRRSTRYLLARFAGISARRPLPLFATQRFDKWFSKLQPSARATRGKVLLWDDTFVRYHEPHIGIAAVRVLTAVGFEVRLVRDRVCCGRPAFSQGHLPRVERLGRHNLELLRGGNDPILFLEPSCYSMFKEDYRELKLPGAQQVADRCWLFEAFMEDLLRREPNALPFAHATQSVAIHAHCHAKALVNTGFMSALVTRLPGRKVQLLNTGCCGMAGAFGATETKYDLSLTVAQPLVDALGELSPQTAVVASGTSCRQQIQHLTTIHPKHMAELLAEALG